MRNTIHTLGLFRRRAATEDTAQIEASCAMCATELQLGPVFVWMSTGTGVDELCEFARSEGLDETVKECPEA